MTHYAKQQSQQKLSAVGLSFSVYFKCMKALKISAFIYISKYKFTSFTFLLINKTIYLLTEIFPY